jgi:flagellar motor component MotA
MLAFAYFSHHIEGSIYFMAPLTLLFAIGVVMFLFILLKKKYVSALTELLKQIGILTFMFGVCGTLVGLLQMFDALESIKDTLPLSVISGGVKVALLNVLYGAAYFCIIQFLYMVLKAMGQQKSGA